MLDDIVNLFCLEHCRACNRLIPTRSPVQTACANCWEEIALESAIYEWVPLDETRALPVASGTAYDGVAKKLIYNLKYDNDRLVARDLAVILAKGFDQLSQDIGERPCFIVPVPLHWRRRYRRRFNQAELLSHELVKLLSRAARTPAAKAALPVLRCQLLKRARNTEAHHQLSKEQRLENVRGAFMAGNMLEALVSESSAQPCIVVVDDIYTSGATLGEVARTLLDAGARHVLGLSVARALLK